MIARSSLWTPREVCEAVSGSLSGSTEKVIRGVATDTRDELTDHLFVALKGERFDAHDFLSKAVDHGASALLVESSGLKSSDKAELSQNVSIVEVSDTLVALGELAAAHRKRINIPLIGLTGSNGKTTTKEMIAAILACEYRVLKTEGNFNNLIGLPMTLLGLNEEHEVGVIEMGMNARGEIERLTEITGPQIGLITNVGPAHIGMLGSMEQVIKAKAELFDGLSADATAVYCVDDKRFASLIPAGVRRVSFGFAVGADVCVEKTRPSMTGQSLTLKTPGGRLDVELPYPGDHNAVNAAAAVAAVLAFAPRTSMETFEKGLSGVTNAARRLDVKEVGPYLVIDDCYNANGDSMVAAIQTVASLAVSRNSRWLAVLGEMRELGSWSKSEHERVGAALNKHNASVVAAFGSEAEAMLPGRAHSSIEQLHEANDFGGLSNWVKERLEPGDLILVKGSRGTRMERFIEQLEGEVN